MTTATTEGPILSFSDEEESRSLPDPGDGGRRRVTTTAPTAVEAIRLNAAAMNKLIAAAKARRIKAEDIQTGGVSLSPQYDYNNRSDGQPPRYRLSGQQQRARDDAKDRRYRAAAPCARRGGRDQYRWPLVRDERPRCATHRRSRRGKGCRSEAADYAKLAGYRAAELVSISEGGAVGASQCPCACR